ncbi:hypothetical protein C8Q75DRAFT_808492 [Abortiporus biennis]|nr:hypothetical protein C8Q75DRAFT_808492 [Abortiporus biennis]
MFPSVIRLNTTAAARKPLIHFIGKRQWPSQPEAPHPHPFAPAELKQAFSDFVAKFKASGSQAAASKPSSSTKAGENVQVYDEFWKAPERLWKQEISEAEVEAILSGGASLH